MEIIYDHKVWYGTCDGMVAVSPPYQLHDYACELRPSDAPHIHITHYTHACVGCRTRHSNHLSRSAYILTRCGRHRWGLIKMEP